MRETDMDAGCAAPAGIKPENTPGTRDIRY